MYVLNFSFIFSVNAECLSDNSLQFTERNLISNKSNDSLPSNTETLENTSNLKTGIASDAKYLRDYKKDIFNYNLDHTPNELESSFHNEAPHHLNTSFQFSSKDEQNLYVPQSEGSFLGTTNSNNSSIQCFNSQSLYFSDKHPQSLASDIQQNPHLASATTSTSTSSSGKSQVRVCINRLNIEDTRLMQQSIKKFVQKSPELARSIGLLQETSQLNVKLNMLPLVSGCVSGDCHSSKNAIADTFSTIKANETRVPAKRKSAIAIGDIPPEEICK